MKIITPNNKITAVNVIFYGVDILINQNTSDETAAEITKHLKTALKYLMCFLRNEDIKNCFLTAAKSIESEYKKVICSPSADFSKALHQIAGFPQEKAFLYSIPALCGALSEKLLKEDDTDLHNRLSRATAVICGNEPITNLASQLLFIGENLGAATPEFMGDEKCKELTEALLEKYNLERDILEDAVYGIFRKSRLSSLRKYAASSDSNEFTELITREYASLDNNTFVDDPFYKAKLERLRFVKGLQKYTLETLILTKKFLEEHGLRFYLTEGTLLGAVRHNGFIPWDDDVDIAMPREDYDKLVELAKEGKVPPELNFDALENNPKHWVLGAKMQLTRQTPYIQHKVTKLSTCNGPYVDIFPLDYWDKPASFKNAKANISVKMCRRLIFIKTGYSKATKKSLARIIARIFLPVMSCKKIQRFAIKNMKKFYNGNRKYMVNLCSYYPYYKEVFPTGFFGEPVYINFEGEKMPVPCEYDYMLKTVYGKSYDTIPPQRVTNMRKHAFELRTEISES